MNNRNELLENYESMRIGTDKTLLIRGHGFILCLFCKCRFHARKDWYHEEYND